MVLYDVYTTVEKMEIKGLLNSVFVVLLFLVLSSCETDHTFQKRIINQSVVNFTLSYNDNSYSVDTVFSFTPGTIITLVDWWKLGNHPESNPLSNCGMTEDDSVLFTFDSEIPYAFIGDFTDENRWESEFESGRSSVHICTFTIVNEDFLYE